MKRRSFVLVLPLIVLLGACSEREVAFDQEDCLSISVGQSRTSVEEVLGPPASDAQPPSGGQIYAQYGKLRPNFDFDVNGLCTVMYNKDDTVSAKPTWFAKHCGDCN